MEIPNNHSAGLRAGQTERGLTQEATAVMSAETTGSEPRPCDGHGQVWGRQMGTCGRGVKSMNPDPAILAQCDLKEVIGHPPLRSPTYASGIIRNVTNLTG